MSSEAREQARAGDVDFRQNAWPLHLVSFFRRLLVWKSRWERGWPSSLWYQDGCLAVPRETTFYSNDQLAQVSA